MRSVAIPVYEMGASSALQSFPYEARLS